MSYDIVNTYFPDFAELSNADVLDMRNRLAAKLHAAYPDIDFRPGTAAGDLVLTPFAHLACAQETAMNRFMSDLDLENVAKGIIFNCDFVSKYLKNFAVVEQQTLQSTGLIRLTFTADQAYEVDRRAQYKFGTDVFRLRLPNPGPLEISAVGVPLTPGVNARNLVELTPGVYVVDVPVVGTMTAQVLAGDSATTDFPIAQVSAITAMANFDFGLPPSSLATLAQLTRQTFYSSTPNTRGGAARFLQKEFPQLIGNSPVLNGDPEMIRDTINALGLTNGRLDLYVRSGQTVTETQIIRLPYYPAQGGGRFIAPLSLTNIPFALDSVVPTNASSVLVTDIVTFSRSKNPALAPMASCAYSNLETLWLTVGMPKDGASNPLVPLDIAADGSQSALFTITYRYDPLLQAVTDLVGSNTATPPGVNTLVRGFLPIFIDSMTVNYTRQRGSSVNIAQASSEIQSYVDSLALPRLYADARIGESMFYAGAQDVTAVDVKAKLQWSVGRRLLPVGAPDPTNYNAAVAASLLPRLITINGSRSLRPVYRDVNLGTNTATYEACGPKNVMLVLPPEHLFFSEVS